MKTLKDVDGQKVRRVLIVVELENGKSLIAKPTEIGDIKGLVTLNDLQRLLSNDDAPEDIKFRSPIVFALDLRDAANRWVEDREKQLLHLKDSLKDDVCFPYNYQIIANGLQSQIHILKHFFNLEVSQ